VLNSTHWIIIKHGVYYYIGKYAIAYRSSSSVLSINSNAYTVLTAGLTDQDNTDAHLMQASKKTLGYTRHTYHTVVVSTYTAVKVVANVTAAHK
jgi:hypothetical protein